METGASAASLLAPLVAGIVSIAAMAGLVRSRALPLDQPNERSLHAVPVPRTGGIAIVGGIVAATACSRAWPGPGPALLLPAGLLALASYLDDRRALPAGARLLVHLIAAGLFLWLADVSDSLVLLAALWLAIAWMTNLYNFMDGADGLAGGMAVIGFGACAAAAWQGGGPVLALLAASVACAAAGFLVFNFPPARIFMGDVGSIPLGFLAGAVGVAGWHGGLWPLWFPLAVFAPFVADASVTLARRLARGERVWQAHRQHYYQRLILAGWSHRRTALAEYALMAACAIAAMAALHGTPTQSGTLLAALAAAVACAMWAIDRRWKKFSAGNG
ncbi:MAG TPA: glycosyltransferase family 4 protein [Burkholderiales bacterium]|nr:glycosyltransferase family 4 protein [Burkholderiales bacterium]